MESSAGPNPDRRLGHPQAGDVLVFDVGEDIVGIYSVTRRKYVAYRGKRILRGTERLMQAAEIVSYNGDAYDLPELARRLALNGKSLNRRGIHTDMRRVYWGDQIWGANLRDTFLRHCEPRSFPDTHEGSNRSDVYMTFRLWKLYKNG